MPKSDKKAKPSLSATTTLATTSSPTSTQVSNSVSVSQSGSEGVRQSTSSGILASLCESSDVSLSLVSGLPRMLLGSQGSHSLTRNIIIPQNPMQDSRQPTPSQQPVTTGEVAQGSGPNLSVADVRSIVGESVRLELFPGGAVSGYFEKLLSKYLDKGPRSSAGPTDCAVPVLLMT